MEELKYVIEDSTIAELLGVQNFSTDEAAILELVKNAYDADAPDVWVEMWDIDKTDKGKIIVKDNGDGMDLSIVENSWMEIGTDNKKIFLTITF